MGYRIRISTPERSGYIVTLPSGHWVAAGVWRSFQSYDEAAGWACTNLSSARAVANHSQLTRREDTYLIEDAR